MLKPLGAGGSGIADGSAQFARIADDAHMEAVEVLDEPAMIESERAGQVGHGGEDDQAEPVVGALADEVLEHLGGNVKARHPFPRSSHIQRRSEEHTSEL